MLESSELTAQAHCVAYTSCLNFIEIRNWIMAEGGDDSAQDICHPSKLPSHMGHLNTLVQLAPLRNTCSKIIHTLYVYC